MAAAGLRKPELKLTGNVQENFRNFETRFNDYCIQAEYRDLTKDPDTEKADHYSKPLMELAALRSSLPDEALQVFRYTIDPQVPQADKKKPWIWMDKLRAHYTGTQGSSLMTDRFTFWSAAQTSQESVQDWEVRVRQLGTLCEYAANLDIMCRDKFVFGINSEAIRAELLRTHLKADGTVKSFRDTVCEAKALESASLTNRLITEKLHVSDSVHFTRHRDMRLKRTAGTCFYCGDTPGSHPWKNCPAKGKVCSRCGGNDHFARVCDETPKKDYKPRRTEQRQNYRQNASNRKGNSRQESHQLEFTPGTPVYYRDSTPPARDRESQENQASESYYVNNDPNAYQTYSLDDEVFYNPSTPGERFFTTVQLLDRNNRAHKTEFQIDSASTCNTIGLTQLRKSVPDVKLSRTSRVLHPYGSGPPISPVGQAEIACEKNGIYHTLSLQVLPDSVMNGKPPLLSGADSVRLGVLSISPDRVNSLQATTTQSLPKPGQFTKESVLTTYKDNFQGLGKLGTPVHFKMNKEIAPIQMPIHRQAISKRAKEKETLDKYEAAGILEKIVDPTPWCSNELIRETPRKFRICLDPSRTINLAIERPYYEMPTLDEHLHKLTKAKCFSVFDAKDGFLQCVLDEESSTLTTMHTSYGRYKWKRMPFGVSSAPEEFQQRIATALENLPGIINIADDILVFGEGEDFESACIDHDNRVVALMDRCRERQLKLNPNKVKFKLPSLKFMGHTVGASGLSIDPERIEAIQKMPTPRDRKGVQRFLGTMQHLSQFCCKLSDVLEPIRRLNKDDVPFVWSGDQDTAFALAKKLVSEAPTLQFYDLNKPVVLQVDASDYGLGGALLQPNAEDKLQPVAFTSCTLTDTEKRYSQIEKECLAICEGFEKWDQLLYGKKDITVHSDHQPLETIFKRPLNRAPARLQKMMMRLQRHFFKVLYKKGTSLLIADTLSRAPLPISSSARVTGFEVFRLELESESHNCRLKSNTVDMIRNATASDPVLPYLHDTIVKGWPVTRAETPPCLLPFYSYREELSVLNGVIYKADRVVIPASIQAEMLKRVHTSHQGSESTSRIAAEFLFWPGMRQAIKDMCDSCSTCAQYSVSKPRQPMMSLPIPTRPYELVSQDLFSFEGRNYLVTVCHYSDWIECDLLPDSLSSTVIAATKQHIARYGIPTRVHTDGGPQFTSQEYQDFARQYEFTHTTSSPYYPKGNGKAEASVKICKNMLKKSSDFYGAMLMLRNTPPQGQRFSPAQRMFHRHTRNFLPAAESAYKPVLTDTDTARGDIINRRAVAKATYDRHSHDLPPLDKGERVYVKPAPNKRGRAWTYGKIVDTPSPRSYTILTPEGKYVRRNQTDIQIARASPSLDDTISTPDPPQMIGRPRTQFPTPEPTSVPTPTAAPIEQPNVIASPVKPTLRTPVSTNPVPKPPVPLPDRPRRENRRLPSALKDFHVYLK